MTKFVPLALVMLLGVGACATAAQRQAQQIKQDLTAASFNVKACIADVQNSPEGRLLKNKIPPNYMEATLDQMADQSKATPEQIAALKITHPKVVSCRENFISQVNLATPSLSNAFLESWNSADINLVLLIQQKISWGEYVTKNKELAIAAQKELIAESRVIDQTLEQSHEREIAQRQTASKAMLDYIQTQQMINSLNRPLVTNCSATFGNISCVSR